jgi:hypothetical protein
MVPYEAALNNITTEVSASPDDNSVNGTILTDKSKYIPAAVVIFVDFNKT